MSIFEDIRKLKTPTLPKVKGLQWVTMLLEYDLEGNAKVIKSFSNPASDSDVKKYNKPKVTKPKEEKFEFNKKEKEKTRMFK